MSITIVQGPRKSGKSTFSKWLADREGKTIVRYLYTAPDDEKLHCEGKEKEENALPSLFVWEVAHLSEADMRLLHGLGESGRDLVVECMECPDGDWSSITIFRLRPETVKLSPWGHVLNYEEQILAKHHARNTLGLG